MKKLILSLMWSVCLSLGAQTTLIPDMKFRRLDTQNGLSSSQVNCIYKDSRGYVWIGTPYGLNRYDGYRVKVFYSNKRDTTTMRDNYTDQIYESADGKLWIEDENVMEMALVENIQREDLNAIEIALAYQHMADTLGMTQEGIADRVGKSRTAITNYMRLLKLPAQIQMALKNHDMDMGHARALLALDSPSAQIKMFKEVQKNGYSVRKVEEMVQMLKKGKDIQTVKTVIPAKTQLPREYIILRDRLTNLFKTKVEMTCSSKGKGKISIPFANEEELERIMNAIDGING